MNELRSMIKIPLMLLTWVIYRFRRMTAPIQTKEPKKILVLYLSGMGDILCASPFLTKLRERFPCARIDGCLPAGFVKLQRDFFLFDGYIAHRRYADTLRHINSESYDLIVIPGWLMRNSVLALLSNAGSIIGYINDLSFTNRYLNSFSLEEVGLNIQPSRQDMRSSHLSERANLILSHYGAEPVQADEVIIKRQAKAQNYAVIHAGARFEGRRWSESRFAELISYLLDGGLCAEVHLIGDATDSLINQHIMEMVKSDKVSDNAGKIDLYQSKTLISASKLFVGNDSGPMHIAALCGVPTLGLLGPNFPHISGPLGNKSYYAWHKFPCTGCNQRGCAYEYRCIKSITTTEAIAKINSLLTDK